MRRSSLAWWLLAGALTACTPPCERTCRKLLACDNLETDRVSLVECQLSCEEEVRRVQTWDDAKFYEDLIGDQRRCLVQSTCEEIERGECYDERLAPVGIPATELDTGA